MTLPEYIERSKYVIKNLVYCIRINMKYKKNIGVLLDRYEGKIFAVCDYQAFELNEVGARILELCNGKNEVRDICSKISNHYKVDESMVNEDVDKYIDLLLANELIKRLK